jgi:excisionase family DNA binding protein
MEVFYTVKEIAAKFSVNVDTVRRWIREGILKAIPISGDRNYRISQESLEEFIKYRGKGNT